MPCARLYKRGSRRGGGRLGRSAPSVAVQVFVIFIIFSDVGPLLQKKTGNRDRRAVSKKNTNRAKDIGETQLLVTLMSSAKNGLENDPAFRAHSCADTVGQP